MRQNDTKKQLQNLKQVQLVGIDVKWYIIGFFRPGCIDSSSRAAFYYNESILQIHTNERGAEIKARPRKGSACVCRRC